MKMIMTCTLIMGLLWNGVVHAQLSNEEQDSYRRSYSKNDIKKIEQKYADKRLNGHRFNVADAIVVMADSDEEGSITSKHELYQKYGRSVLTNVLHRLAITHKKIKQMEHDYSMIGSIGDEVQVGTTDFDSWNMDDAYIRTSYRPGCMLDYKIREEKTKCWHDKGSSGLFGLSLFIMTAGTFGSTDGYRTEKTVCQSERIFTAVHESRTPTGEKLLSERTFKAVGIATKFHENVWFRGDLIDQAREHSANALDDMEYKMAQDACITLPEIQLVSSDNTATVHAGQNLAVADQARTLLPEQLQEAALPRQDGAQVIAR